ncbi:MAG: hypothetical protein QF790_08950 [Gammaproteobacteria bacterium]|jgi:hypothetical protein|nr:hypothetical protein [Gammaproteobacteria bacterium]MDP6617276.1 hypothetical protein [Gammaproteobacteria bacterium]MDP6694054.1 hypothetical protein [Gammaproteobacteria bacterium]MDP7041394.1 hypothetical protein [Gammaproteobacteria bacterium]
MFGNPSLLTRIAIGKAIGLVVGLIGFFALPYFMPEDNMLFRWGILLWYTTVGGVIGVMGVITYHPVLRLPMSWWFRAPLVGAWMNFVLAFFIYDILAAMLVGTFGEDSLLQSPFWLVAEGALVGLLIGFFATRFGGEGKAAMDMDHPGAV